MLKQKKLRSLRLLPVILMLIAFVCLSSMKAKAEESTSINENEVNELLPNVLKIKADLKTNTTPYDITFKEGEDTLVYKVTAKEKSALDITISALDNNYSSITVSVYSDSNLTKKVGYPLYLFSGDTIVEKVVELSGKGTYYLEFELSRKRDFQGEMIFPVELSLISAGNRVIEPKVEYLTYQGYDTGEQLYKITVDNAGLIAFYFTAVDTTEAEYANITLLNSAKKAISERTYISTTKLKDKTYGSGKVYFAVSKGTYYVSVKTTSELHSVNYSFAKVADKSGKSKEKATNLKLGGATVKGLCNVTDKTTKEDWFKFTLTAEKAIKVTINSKINGRIRFELIGPTGSTILFGSKTLYEGDDTLLLESNGKFSKGTYYVKVYKMSDTSSGYYNIKVK